MTEVWVNQDQGFPREQLGRLEQLERLGQLGKPEQLVRLELLDVGAIAETRQETRPPRRPSIERFA